jgi:uncharacterized protein (TIGR03086 family)
MSSTTVSPAALVESAAGPMREIVKFLDPAKLGAPTPCTEWDVRALLNHLLFWGPGLEAAARKEPNTPPAAAETDLDLLVGDWRTDLDGLLGRLVQAWTAPAAWEGTTSVATPEPLPAAVIGGMVVGELVVHGWDLGRALGLRPEWDKQVLTFVHGELVATADMGRQMGYYGPEVPVPPSAPTLARLLGVTGRDPSWAGS